MATARGIRIVGFFEKGTRPTDRRKAWNLQALAYQAADELGIRPKEILIRSDLHETTTIKGQTVKDPGGFHATISIRGEEHIKDNTFLSVHAYTRGKNDFTLRHASRAAQPLALTTTGRAGKLIWPANLTEEETFFVDPPEESASAPEEHATGQEGSRTGQEVSTTTQASDTGVQMTANSSCTAP